MTVASGSVSVISRPLISRKTAAAAEGRALVSVQERMILNNAVGIGGREGLPGRFSRAGRDQRARKRRLQALRRADAGQSPVLLQLVVVDGFVWARKPNQGSIILPSP